MMKLPALFSDKRVRYGSYSVIMTVAVVAIVLTINLVISQFSLKWDNSGNQLYSISEESLEVINGLSSDVTIYTLFRTGSETELYQNILLQFDASSPRITVENRDPYLYPNFVNQYTEEGVQLPADSVIVVCGTRYRVISSADYINYTYDYQNYTRSAESLELEPLVTNALRYVTAARTIKVYTLSGHDERALPEPAVSQMDIEGYETESLNLLSANEVPEDCDILMITTPSRDISPGEREAIERYLIGGGEMIAMIDNNGVPMPEIQTLLGSYGMGLDGSYVFEGDASHTIQGQPYFCLPVVEEHEIGNPLRERSYAVLMAFSQGVSQLELRKQSVKLYPLLTTTDKAYGKLSASPQTVEKEPGDIDGPLYLAIAAEDQFDYDNPTRIVVYGSVNFLENELNSVVSGANVDIFMNSLSWLAGQEQGVYVRSKSLLTDTLQINGAQQLLLLLVSVVLIPFAVLILGLVSWLKRRHK